MNELWNDIAGRAGVPLDARQHALLEQYLDLLFDANRRMNLTRITDRAAARVQHVGDGLTLLAYLPRERFTLADVGSGGGVPGLPLAIARPDANVLLIESTRKKAAFLRDAIKQLRLSNASVIDARAEDVGRGERRETFDVVAARAVGALAWLVEWCLPLTRKGGKVLAMKGAKVNEELQGARKAIRLLGGGEPTIHSVGLPGAEHHVIVEVPKVRLTPATYPRIPTATRGKPIG